MNKVGRHIQRGGKGKEICEKDWLVSRLGKIKREAQLVDRSLCYNHFDEIRLVCCRDTIRSQRSRLRLTVEMGRERTTLQLMEK